MTHEMQAAETFFLEKFGLTEQTLERTLGAVLGKRVDYADLYFEYRVNEEIGLEEGIVKQAAKSISQGVGVRATAEEKTGFAYSDEITVSALQIAAERSRYIAAESGEFGERGGRRRAGVPLAICTLSGRLRRMCRSRRRLICWARSIGSPGPAIPGSRR